ncbi:tyrosine-type recombinase/integrase [Sporosarcina sp. FSL K6-1508]|uniref:tyrosine-type recombinase/integrase n=1 Tax=Sporosarcina sp. FSL K6-1508 TaxID=2921553 RepID=UPI0030F7A8F0
MVAIMKEESKKRKKSKKHFTSKEPEVFWYLNAKGEKLWGYRHRYYDALKNRREKPKQGLASENIAIRELLKVKTDLINGNVKRVDYENITVAEWVDTWFDANENDWEISTRAQREQAIRLVIKPLLGKEKLTRLERSTYKRKYVNALLKKYDPGSVQLYHNIFKIIVNAAVEEEILPRNRFNKIVIINDKKNENFLNPDELKAFLTFAKNHECITNYTLLLILAFTGMRRGEMLGLQWNNIDFENKTISIERTRDHHGTRKPKTKNSIRTFFVDDTILNQLKTYRVWCKKTMLTYGNIWTETDYVLTSERFGTPISEKSVSEPIKRIIKETGIKRITPHGLRHTHATIMMSKGVPLNTIADRLGNTPEMVLRVYGHSFKELEIESVIAFSDAVNY